MRDSVSECSNHDIRPLILLLVTVGKHRHDVPALQSAYVEYAGAIRQHLDEIGHQIAVLEELYNYLTEEMSACTPGANMYNVGQTQRRSIKKEKRKLSDELHAVQGLFREALATTP